MPQTFKVELYGGILDGKEMFLVDPPLEIKVPIMDPVPAAYMMPGLKYPTANDENRVAVYRRRGVKRHFPGTLVYTLD
jgi:hypothetical protein